jgi:GNAT superfamily N-acetyltransferase
MCQSSFPATQSISLGDGLVLRWSTPQDQSKIEQAASLGFASCPDRPNLFMARTVARLMRGDCPAMTPTDFCLIEDRALPGAPVVACACLQSYEWIYDGIAIPVGRPEVVTTIPAYRRRGLTRALFTALHRRSQQQGHLLQAIVGIPFFYRRLGYEYAVDLGGKYILSRACLPRGDEQEPPSIGLRQARVEDIPFLQCCYRRRCEHHLLSSAVPDNVWRYYLEGWQGCPDDQVRSVHLITDRDGSRIGFVLTAAHQWWKQLDILALELSPEANWFEIVPSVLQALIKADAAIEHDVALAEIALTLGKIHPAYEVLRARGYSMTWQRPDGWYVRIPDSARLLQHLTPVLQQRRASSLLASYTGEQKLDLYTGGLRFVFERDHLSIESWKRHPTINDADAHLPEPFFWQLILGYRSIADLSAIPDVLVDQEQLLILDALFPARSTFVLPLEMK